jgi:hypothetical protein
VDAPAGPTISQQVDSSTVHYAHGTIKVKVNAKKAGSCSIYVDWSARYGSQNTGVLSQVWVKPYQDSCGGGGTLKFRAEMICQSDSGDLHYYYGPWNNGAGNTSYVDQAWYCWRDVNTHNGAPAVAAFQENMNNPTRITCNGNLNFQNGDNVHGSNCGTTT